jgi:hypothetical protein
MTVPMVFSGDETCDVGKGTGSAVSPDYGAKHNEFSGEVNWVEIDIGKDSVNLDHLISPEQRLELAMARQAPSLGQRLRNSVRLELELWSLIVTDVENVRD